MRFRALSVLLAVLGLVGCSKDSNPVGVWKSTPALPLLQVTNVFQVINISPLAGSKLVINENFHTYEEYLAQQVSVDGTFTLRDEDLPACVALLFVREDGADSVIVGGASSQFRNKPAVVDTLGANHLLSETFWGKYARGHVVNAMFIVGKPSSDSSCGNRMLDRCGGAEDVYRTCIRWENVAQKQLISIGYTLGN